MEIGTFGAVFDTAVRLEEHLTKRYETHSADQAGDMQEIYQALAAGGQKRLKRLERIRRETVTEMILEPIHDLRLADDLAMLRAIDVSSPFSPEEAHQLELSASAFYREAAEKIGLAEAARALRQLGEENARRAAQLTGSI